jgi:hypothetical protein
MNWIIALGRGESPARWELPGLQLVRDVGDLVIQEPDNAKGQRKADDRHKDREDPVDQLSRSRKQAAEIQRDGHAFLLSLEFRTWTQDRSTRSDLVHGFGDLVVQEPDNAKG